MLAATTADHPPRDPRSRMNRTPRLEGMHAATSSRTGWIETHELHGSRCLFCGDPAGAFKPLAQSVKRLWWCRPCETTWVD
jgi:hypothetical protein